ncbi:Holliday junction resolvase RuvX [soil metagenome]
MDPVPPPPHPGDVVIALDVGDARIGVARGEVGSPFAFGRGTIPGGNDAATLVRLTELLERERASRLLLGLPLRTDGRDSAQTTSVRALAERLRDLAVPVELVDERFTTQAAQRRVRGSGLPRGKRQEKGRLDEASAVLILEGWLTRYARPAVPPEGDAPA